ncbi:MAG: DNA replication and repair protein RecF [Lentisphaeria bacterium]|nr:DNA replication and repair protein RecF [Lentisphaeria bacterium]
MGILSRLRLQHFRNYELLDLCLVPGVTLLTGANGQGKTNILEAIHYLALLRSFRTRRTSEMIRFDSQTFLVDGAFEVGEKEVAPGNLRVCWGEQRLMQVDGVRVDLASQFINRFICFSLVPEDIALVKGSASERRRFLNIALAQAYPGYLGELQFYHQALRQRNSLLRRSDTIPANALEAYDAVLVKHGSRIERIRCEFVHYLDGTLLELSGELLPGASTLSAQYSPKGLGRGVHDIEEGEVAEQYETALRAVRARDQREGRTCMGPHLADMMVSLGGKSLHKYGSEGECRIGSLALRLACLKMMRARAYEGGRPLVLLIDDVTGELDSVRRDAFMRAIQSADQIIATTTEARSDFCGGDCAAAYRVEAGKVTKL